MDPDSASFFDQVYKIAREVPLGRVTTYGAIARYIGTGRSARLVGWAMNSSEKIQPPVPAHRVVNRKGLLTGKHYFDTDTLMQELLENEGVKIVNDQVQDFEKVYWNPMKELPRDR